MMRPLFLLLSGSALLVGCTHVKPYERDLLARPSMDSSKPSEVMEARFQGHVREAREASTASAGAAGGGCGCN